MRIPVLLPELGAAHVELSLWLASAGDEVQEGERLVEVLLGGATFDVAAPASGVLVEQLAWPGDSLQPGQELGMIETGEKGEG